MMYGIGMYRVMHACLNIHTTGTGEFWIKDREDLFMTTRNLKRGCGSRDRTHGLAWRCPIVRISSVRSEVTLLLKHRLMEETSALGAAGRDVAPLVIDVDDVERAISAVVGKVQVRRSRVQPDGAAAGGEDAGRALRLAQAILQQDAPKDLPRRRGGSSDAAEGPFCSVRRILGNA